jgi:hypothetical protein
MKIWDKTQKGDAIPQPEGLDSILGAFRDSAYSAAERPEAFWTRQRAAIVANLQRPVAGSGRRPAMAWVSAAAALLLCLFLFVEKSKAPTPDIAAGSDQDLLVEVDQALNQYCPEALTPAALIAQEIEQATRKAGH